MTRFYICKSGAILCFMRFVSILAVFCVLSAGAVFAAEVKTEQLNRTVTRAATEMARGRNESAVYAAIPRTNISAAQTNIAFNRNLLRINQAVEPVNRLGGSYLNTRANLNATAKLQGTRPPSVTPAAQFHAGNKYFSNSTTVKNK